MAEDEPRARSCLLDGHGEAGHLVSQQFKDKYAAAVFNSLSTNRAARASTLLLPAALP